MLFQSFNYNNGHDTAVRYDFCRFAASHHIHGFAVVIAVVAVGVVVAVNAVLVSAAVVGHDIEDL